MARPGIETKNAEKLPTPQAEILEPRKIPQNSLQKIPKTDISGISGAFRRAFGEVISRSPDFRPGRGISWGANLKCNFLFPSEGAHYRLCFSQGGKRSRAFAFAWL